MDVPFHEVNGFLSAEEPAEVRAVSNLTGEAKAYRSGRDVFVLGKIAARVEYQCVRCLEPFEGDVKSEFHRVFSEGEEYGAGEVELHREDLDLEPIEGESIDLARIAAEELALALAAHPVCRESCRGLCPSCGTNRNVSACSCAEERVDPRFAALQALKR